MMSSTLYLMVSGVRITILPTHIQHSPYAGLSREKRIQVKLLHHLPNGAGSAAVRPWQHAALCDGRIEGSCDLVLCFVGSRIV